MHAINCDAQSTEHATVLSKHVPPFSQRFGWHPIFTLQCAPLKPNGHADVVLLANVDVVTDPELVKVDALDVLALIVGVAVAVVVAVVVVDAAAVVVVVVEVVVVVLPIVVLVT